MKIHRQFGHASSDNMKLLLKQENLLLDKVYNTCKTCKEYKNPLNVHLLV